jgi:hypothetical protein
VAIRNTQIDDDNDPAARIVNATIPDDFYAYIPLSFQDYATALNAQRKCTLQPSGGRSNASLGWGITGMAFQGANWMVPMIKCDPSACTNVGQDATKMCEFSILAVSAVTGTGSAGGMKRAQDFAAWVYDFYYPLLNKTASTSSPASTNTNATNSSSSSSSSPLPDFDLVQIFESSQQIEDYVKSELYGTTGYPKIAMALLWNSNSSNDYSFTLRQNSTNFNNPKDAGRPGTITTPDTSRLFEHYARNDFSVCADTGDGPNQGFLDASCTGQYVYNGILTFQRLAGDYILNRTGTARQFPVATSGGVTFVQFPTLPYEENGFYASIADFAPLFVVLGLLYPVASMVSYIAKEKELKQKELMKMMSVMETDMYVLYYFFPATRTTVRLTCRDVFIFLTHTLSFALCSYIYFFANKQWLVLVLELFSLSLCHGLADGFGIDLPLCQFGWLFALDLLGIILLCHHCLLHGTGRHDGEIGSGRNAGIAGLFRWSLFDHCI